MKPEHLSENVNSPLARWEQLQGGNERQRHRFSGLVLGFGSRRSISDTLEESIGVGF